MTNKGSSGVLLITWDNPSDERIQDIISNIFSKNEDVITGMKYYEVSAEHVGIVNDISKMFEVLKSDVEPKTPRKERSLEAYC